MSIHVDTEARIAAAIMERKGQAGTPFADVLFARGAEFSCRGFVQVDISNELGLQPLQIVDLVTRMCASVEGMFPGDATVKRICTDRNILVMPIESREVTIARVMRYTTERVA